MVRDAGKQSGLFVRIHRWQHEVVKDTLLHAPTQSPSRKCQAHHMKLRPRDTRPALVEVSGNSYSRKRKASTTMADAPPRKHGKKKEVDKKVEEAPRRSEQGRIPKIRADDIHDDEYTEQSVSRRQDRPANIAGSAKSYESSLSSRSEFPPPETPQYGSTLPSTSNRSPSERAQVTLNDLIPENAIDMEYLARCDPPVYSTSFRQVKRSQKSISSLADDLHQKLESVPLGLIPSALEVCFSLFNRNSRTIGQWEDEAMAFSHGHTIRDIRDEGDMYPSRALFIWPAHQHMAFCSNPSLLQRLSALRSI